MSSRMLDVYRLLGPLWRKLEPETAHAAALLALRSGIASIFYSSRFESSKLKVNLWNTVVSNPIGLAAGFDKNAQAYQRALDMGFGFVEVGGVTPKPQPGNPPPRLFRLNDDKAIINRMGFNNDGADVVADRLAGRDRTKGLVGVNLGKNKTSEDAPADYAALASKLSALADFLVINVSSPNTPGLRALQNTESLVQIIRAARKARDEAVPNQPPKLLLKISPDLEEREVEEIAGVALDEKLDALVVSNTTIARPKTLKSSQRTEAGGLSGAPLFDMSTNLLRRIYSFTDGNIPLIGVGGVSSGAQAYEKILAGATLVQLYSALIYEGPGLVHRILTDLTDLLDRDGFSSISEAVGQESTLRKARSTT